MEMIDSLHLRGWRLMTVVGVALAGSTLGIFVSSGTTYQSDHILFAGQLAASGLSPAQVEDFADELRLAATLPGVQDSVTAQFGGSYDVEVRRTASDTSIQFVSTSSTSEEQARQTSRATAVASAEFVLGQTIERDRSLLTALETELTTIRSEQDALIIEGGGIDPITAVSRASELLFDARQDADGGDVAASIQARALETELDALRPLAQRYEALSLEAASVVGEIGQVDVSFTRAQNSFGNIDSELVIAEVDTFERSSLPLIVRNMLIFAGANVLVLVMIFYLAGSRPAAKQRSNEDDDATDSPLESSSADDDAVLQKANAQGTKPSRTNGSGAQKNGNAAGNSKRGQTVKNGQNSKQKTSQSARQKQRKR